MASSSIPSCHQSIPSTGLTVVVEPDKADLDIVFVHGFTGHPERTWTHKKGDIRQQTHVDDEPANPPSKIRKFGPFSKSRQEDFHTALYWPRDLIPSTAPTARVFTYGYDTHIRHKLGPPVNRNTVYDIAWDFLVALEAERDAEPSRPVLFIVHSLGGVIVKEMLRRSSGCRRSQTHLWDIFQSTIGIIFFGTPHGGADPRGILQHIAERAIKAAGISVNEHIVNSLLPSSERLRELRDEFGPMALEQHWIIQSFQEQLGVAYLSGHKVVEDTSSYLNLPAIEISEHIGRNHMDMCRFTGPNDVEYRKVASALRRIMKSVSSQPKREEKPLLNNEQKKILLNSLRFDQIDARQKTIKIAHARTCKWLLRKSEYLEWLDTTKRTEHHGFLWIKGKPGAGKSTLMKFALTNARKTNSKIVISYFFNARGERLERSTIGMYQSLLLQLLERIPALQCVLDSLSHSLSNISAYHEWSIELLKELLSQAIQKLGHSSVVCFIDALDECEEHQVRDMISFYESLGELAVSVGVEFQVCFSSRHYPHITITKGLDLVLEGQEGHNQDITNYLASELKIGRNKTAEQIRAELQEKASGVFMWIILVVEILNKEYDSGRIFALQRRLREIPSDLHELFRDILTRDSHHREELILCIRWILFARQPLSPEQLYFAILSGVEPGAFYRWDSDEIPLDAIKRFILDSSKGLAEITTSKFPRVQFIHESVKDFLTKENGLGNVWPEMGSNFQGQSHEQLKLCCLNYISVDVSTYLELSKGPWRASSSEAAALRESAALVFPFLEYAIHNVLYHADIAAENGISQKDFMQNFQLADWIDFNNFFEKHQVRRYTQDASLLYILAERNMSHLIRGHPSILSCLQLESERYGTPFFASLATRSEEAIQAFLEVHAVTLSSESHLHALYGRFCHEKGIQGKLGRDFKFSSRRTVMSYLVELGSELAFALLLGTGKLAVDTVDEHSRTLLSWAAEKGYETVVKLLLGRVAADTKDNEGRTPLLWAAMKGHEVVVKLLLETGRVDVDIKDKFYRQTPLSWAAENGHEKVVKLLLETGKTDVNKKDKSGRTPLSRAAENGHTAIVKLLLETGNVEIDSKDKYGQTPLLWAAKNGHEVVVKLLLETGKVEVDIKDDLGWTPLSWAAMLGHKEVVKLLLETGKVGSYDQMELLRLAAANGHEGVVKLLLETGKVDDCVQIERLKKWAESRGYKTMVNMLQEIPRR